MFARKLFPPFRNPSAFAGRLFFHLKKWAPVLLLLGALLELFSCSGADSKSSPLVKSTKQTTGLPLVELFTSEGCSSCPPADRLLGQLNSESDAIVLSYHVDYWDRLGWKDPFSQAAFTDRQRQYAKLFSIESIYTPQAVVNGAKELVGSDEKALRSLLQTAGKTDTPIQATAVRNNSETVQLSYTLPQASASLLNIALVQPEATTTVKGGENGGRTLHHVNVVRVLKTIEPQSKGTVDLKLDANLQQTPLSLVVFTQEKKDLKINGAIQLAVPLYENKKSN